MESRLAIVGIFYDGYYDIWEDFLELFSGNWRDCPYPVYIVNGEKDLSFDKTFDVTVIHAGHIAEYSRKVQVALNEIHSDYYLLLLEDFFFERQIINDPLDSILESMIRNNIKYLRMTMPEFLVGIREKKYKKDKMSGFSCIPSNEEYTVSCQPSIWDGDFLRQRIGTGNYNAWVFEGMYAYSKLAHSEEFLSKCRIDFSNPLGLRHGALQGKMLPNVYDDISSTGYKFKNKREVLSQEQYQKHINKQKLKGMIPYFLQPAIKRALHSNSVVEKYREQIVEQMNAMNLE